MKRKCSKEWGGGGGVHIMAACVLCDRLPVVGVLHLIAGEAKRQDT